MYEVKPEGRSASAQLKKYEDATGCTRGTEFTGISNIPVVGDIKMNLSPHGDGVIWYNFTLNGDHIDSPKVNTEMVNEAWRHWYLILWGAFGLNIGLPGPGQGPVPNPVPVPVVP
jgi:hypothetical protein